MNILNLLKYFNSITTLKNYAASVVLELHPTRQIVDFDLKNLWNKQERDLFRRTSTILFTAGTFVYLASYYFIDRAISARFNVSTAIWFKYRIGMATLSVITVFLI